MANKIFVSYRREDSAGNALGISQYLEREFGRRKRFHRCRSACGHKISFGFGTTAEGCGVVLVLIGPHWLEARDAEGNRRLENPTGFD
jgi:hypothetical protein